MASSFSVLLSSLLVLGSTAAAIEFRVGGPLGWMPPTGHESETFNQWATRNRFQIGDTLYFKYEKNNDSVLVVERKDYAACNTTSPLLRFTDGNTTFRLDRHGHFYFISGGAGHCKAGQKLIVRVMVQSDFPSPAPAPGPEAGGASDGRSGSNDWFSPSHQPNSSASSKAVVSVCMVAAAVLSSAVGVWMLG